MRESGSLEDFLAIDLVFQIAYNFARLLDNVCRQFYSNLMVDKAEPGSISRKLPDIQAPKVEPFQWPKRPQGHPRKSLEEFASRGNPAIPNPPSLTEKPSPFSIADAPSATVSEERRQELRDLGKEVAGKKLGLLDEGGIVDLVKAAKPAERNFLLVSYAESVIDDTTREASNLEEDVTRISDRQDLMSKIADLVKTSEEAGRDESVKTPQTAA